jgi:hypothetical protein
MANLVFKAGSVMTLVRSTSSSRSKRSNRQTQYRSDHRVKADFGLHGTGSIRICTSTAVSVLQHEAHQQRKKGTASVNQGFVILVRFVAFIWLGLAVVIFELVFKRLAFGP